MGHSNQEGFAKAMTTTKIRVNEDIELKKFPDRLGRFQIEVVKGQKEAIERGIQRSIPDLVKASPVDTGLYAASWEFTVTEKTALIGNTAPYAPVIEFGARPFTPPIGPLLAWAKRVTKSPSQPPNYDSDVWGLAKAVQAKFAREGYTPRNVLTNMMPKIMENIKKELERAP